jgi:hypothetical protein
MAGAQISVAERMPMLSRKRQVHARLATIYLLRPNSTANANSFPNFMLIPLFFLGWLE